MFAKAPSAACRVSTVSHVSVARYPFHACNLGRAQSSRARALVVMKAGDPDTYIEVEALKGIKLVPQEVGEPQVQYLVSWKSGEPDTWEPAINLSEDLVRDYEEKWWNAARKVDIDAMSAMLVGGKKMLANVLDENKRSALHFAAGLGNVNCVKLLIAAGANINQQDVQGYTPLHMAGGYMHVPAIIELLSNNADPTIKDNTGRDVVSLVENLRTKLPPSMAIIQRRLALEEVNNVLIEKLYDEVEPTQILEARTTMDGSREFLVSFAASGRDDEWVPESAIAKDLLDDFDASLEYSVAAEVLDVVQVGTERRFKIRWADDYPTSWEAEENVPADLIALFQQQNPALFEQRTTSEVQAEWTEDYVTQYKPSSKKSEQVPALVSRSPTLTFERIRG